MQTIRSPVGRLRNLRNLEPIAAESVPELNCRLTNTAQATGALAFMPYNEAHEYSDIYTEQRDLEAAELQAVRDTTMSLGPFLNVADSDPNPTREEAMLMKRQIEVLQGQLLLVDSYLRDMDRQYKKFLDQRLIE